LFLAPCMMVGAATEPTVPSLATAGAAGKVTTPAIATTAIAMLEKASFNHWFTSDRVCREAKFPGISRECVDVGDLSL